jgi:hypothetical protein
VALPAAGPSPALSAVHEHVRGSQYYL